MDQFLIRGVGLWFANFFLDELQTVFCLLPELVTDVLASQSDFGLLCLDLGSEGPAALVN